MAKIDVGNFGNSTIEVAPQPRTSVVGEAVQGLGGAVEQAGARMAEQRFQQQAAIAANNLQEHRLKDQQIIEGLKDGLANGDLQPEDAAAEYQKQSAANTPPEVQHLAPDAAAAYTLGAKRVTADGTYTINALADVARKHRFQDQFSKAEDTLGKSAGLPGTTPDKVQSIIDQFRTSWGPVGHASGLPPDQVDKAIQNFADNVWFNNAVQRSIENHDNMAGLKQLQHDLTDPKGLYAEKLDTNKRNAVMAQVTNRMDTIQNRLIHEADKRDADGLRAMNEYNQQIASGVVAPAGQMAQWAQRTDGTSSSADFADAIKQEQAVQDVLRKPPADQVSYVQDKQAALYQNGGTVREVSNLERTRAAVTKNINTMQQTPLLFYQQRTGDSVTALDWSALLPGQDATLFAKQLQQRALTIATMQKQYGSTVQNKPLLPQEAAQLASLVERNSPEHNTGLFGALRQSAGDDATYQAIMAQIAPDAPVKALAGRLASKQRDITLQRNWIASDVVASSPEVAKTMLQGEALLNKSKLAKSEDGKPKAGLYLPETTTLQYSFQYAVGTAFAGRPGAADVAFQAVQAYYVGKAAATGRLAATNQDIDSHLVREAVTATIGTVVDYNGNGDVLAPWGMDRPGFEASVQRAYSAAVAAKQIPAMEAAQMGAYGLRNLGEYTYLVTNGRKLVADSKGQPLVLTLHP